MNAAPRSQAALRVFAGLLLTGFCGSAIASEQESFAFERSYSAKAYITLLGFPIFSRSSVGSGFASVEQRNSGNVSTFVLRFVSASNPARTQGLNRMGFLQEEGRVQALGGKFIEGRYLGLMTASGEKNFEEAKAALNSAGQSTADFVAAKGSLDSQAFHYILRHMSLPASYGLSNMDAVVRSIESEFASGTKADREATTSAKTPGATTFLWAICSAIQSPKNAGKWHFTYNGSFELRADKRTDTSTGETFARVGIVASPADVVLLNGSIYNEANGQMTPFRLWFDKRSRNFLPLRFEMRPKSFLRLVYELTPGKAISPPRASTFQPVRAGGE